MGADQFDTVITGAGISRDEPSCVPMGDALAASTWRSLFDEKQWPELHELCASSVDELGDWDTGLRLEHLLEVLSLSLPLPALVRIYAFMDRALPNPGHTLLAQLPRHQHFTLNMDTLLEKAGSPEQDLIHLHGRCDRPDTIITTVKQYLAMLPDDLHNQLVAAVDGKSVLVVGYSGRDFDVFPLLVDHPPRHLRWLVHPGSEMAPEVRAGLDAMSQSGRCTVDDSEGTLEDVFPDRWAALPDDDTLTPADWPPASRFEDLPVSARALGAARVLFEIGELDKLERLAQLRPCSGEDAIHLRKVLARSARRRDHNARALLMLLKPPRTLAQARVWVRNGNEVSSLLSRMGVQVAGAGLDRIMLTAARSQSSPRAKQLQLTLQTRLGQRASALGDVEEAARRLRAVVHAADLVTVVGPAGEADAITWLLDALKGTGGYREAVELLPQLSARLAYTNLSQRAYAIWQGGTIHLLRGDATTASEQFNDAAAAAEQGCDGQALAWIAASQSEALRGRDDARAGDILRKALEHPTSRNYLVHQFLLTQSAEHARHLGDLDGAARAARQAAQVSVPGRVGPRRRSLNYLAIRMILLLVKAEQNPDGDWPAHASRLRRRYEQQGARAAATDIKILQHHLGHDRFGLDVDRAAVEFTQRGWLDQADRVQVPWDWRRPWHIIA